MKTVISLTTDKTM